MRRSRSRWLLLWFLARKSLFSSRLTVVLLVMAIAAGAGFQIPNTANLRGFADALLDVNLAHGLGDIRVEPRDQPRFSNGDATAAQIVAKIGGRARPMLVYAGAVGVRGRFLGAPIYGVDLEAAPAPFHVTDGKVPARGDDSGLMLGSSLAKRLAVKVGDEIELRVIFGAAGAALTDDNLGKRTMTVRAIVAGAFGGYRFVFVDRALLAREAGEPTAASMIAVHLDDHETAGALAVKLDAAMPELQSIGWREDDPFLGSYLDSNNTITRVSFAMVVAAVAIPMWALLYIHVLKRRREIGILAALGFGRAEVFAIYVLQALIVAIVGCVIGAAIGYAAIRYFEESPIFAWENLIVKPVTSVRTFVMPALVITVTAIVAGSYPAWRAARTDPAKVLRRIE